MALSCLNRGEFNLLRFGKGPNRSDFASWTGICTGYGSTRTYTQKRKLSNEFYGDQKNRLGLP